MLGASSSLVVALSFRLGCTLTTVAAVLVVAVGGSNSSR